MNLPTEKLRSQINQLFDDTNLEALCLDHFREVFDQFGRGMRKDEKITLLLDHCRRDPKRYQKLIATIGGAGGEVENILIGKEPNFLHQIWDILDSDLQDALSLAYNQSRRERKNIISTRRFFGAIVRLQPKPLPDLFNYLPKGALPDPIDKQLTAKKLILNAEPQLSTCIENSLRHLSEKTMFGQRLPSADVFVDIAKYGTGSSIARLRTYGVTPEIIDKIVVQLGWIVVRR